MDTKQGAVIEMDTTFIQQQFLLSMQSIDMSQINSEEEDQMNNEQIGQNDMNKSAIKRKRKQNNNNKTDT